MANALGVDLSGGITEEVKNEIAEKFAVALFELTFKK